MPANNAVAKRPKPKTLAKPVLKLNGQEREPLLGCAIGKKGIGKTWRTIQIIKQYVQGVPAKGIKGKKVLIVDVNDEYQEFMPIAIKDVARYAMQQRPEIRRVRIYKDDGSLMSIDEMAQTLNDILLVFRNGLLVIEDPSRYLSDNLGREVIGAICTQRHRGCDLILHFQTIGKIAQPKIWGNLNYVRFHKCADNVERHKYKFGGDTEHLQIAEVLVDLMYKNDQYFFCYVNLDKNKISGKFSKENFYTAIDEYMSLNYKDVLRPLVEKRDTNTGKKAYTYQNAHSEVRTRLFQEYYGNAA